jgi:hypothetical protein
MKPIRNPRTGKLSYRITGTIRGKQRKRQFSALEIARETQTEWEIERTLEAKLGIFTQSCLPLIRWIAAFTKIEPVDGRCPARLIEVISPPATSWPTSG